MAQGFLQVLGLLRWSYPSDPSAFDLTGTTVDEIRAELYRDDRLEERMFYLENVILPCLAAQTDKNFKVVMLMGNQLPLKWRTRVLEAVSLVSQIMPVFEEEGQQHREICRAVMMEHRNPRAAAVAEFRLDDDDAICRDFVEALRREFRRHRQLLEPKRKFAIDFTQGFAMVTKGDEVSLHPIHAQLWVASLALIYRPMHKRSLIDYPHKMIWKSMPILSIPGEASWIRGIHNSNDSAIGERHFDMHSWKFDPAETEAVMFDRFGIDWPHLQEAWAQLRAKAAA